MNLRISDERTDRSKSPKRYSLNRKIKEKESRKEPITDSVKSSPFSSGACGITESGRGGKELSPYEMRKADFTGIKNVTSVAKGAANLDQHVGFISPMMEKKTCQSPKGVRNDVTSQYPTPVPLQPDTNNTPMMPCNPGEFRSIATQLKRNSSRQPENPFRAQTQYASRSYNHAQHYGNFQGTPGRFQGHNLPQNVTGAVHPAMLLNIPQNNHSMQPYMTPFQSPGFQVNQIAQIRMQRNREAYNAFTAYGHPFGVFWSRQN